MSAADEGAVPVELTLASWRVGLKKISLNDLLRERTGMGLAPAHAVVERLLAQEPTQLVFATTGQADRFRLAAEELGAIFAESLPLEADALVITAMPEEFAQFVRCLSAGNSAMQSCIAAQMAQWDPGEPLLNLLLGELGHVIAVDFASSDAAIRQQWFDCIETGLVDCSQSLQDSVSTGLLEALWHKVAKQPELAAQVHAQMGTQARAYIDAWDAFNGIDR